MVLRNGILDTRLPQGRTFMMRVLQVEKSRPLLLPYLPFLLELLLVVMKFIELGGLLFWQSPLKPHLPQKHVQCEGPHHKTRIEGESGSEGLHAGPGVSLSVVQLGRCWVRHVERERERESMDTSFPPQRPQPPAVRPTSRPPSPRWRMRPNHKVTAVKVWLPV